MIDTDHHDWLAERALRTPSAPALVFDEARWSFRELHVAASDVADGLRAAGISPDDHVALLAGNRPPTVVAVHAVPRLGATLVPLNLRLTDDELAYQIEVAQPGLLLADAERLDVAERLAARCGVPVRHLEDDPGEGNPTIAPITPVSIPGTQTHTIMYTSGTTGRPKGAMLTAGNHFASAVASMLNLGAERDDRWLCCVPLFHVAGLSIVVRSVVSGFPLVLHDGFDPDAVSAAIEDDGVTIVSLVPQMLQRLLDARAQAGGDPPFPPAFRCALTGGGPVPKPLLDRCAAIGVPVTQTYGLTETASQVATLAPGEALSHLGAAGKPLWGSRIRLRQDGGDVPVGRAGEIQVQGPTVMSGYFQNPEATAAAFEGAPTAPASTRWLRTGDIGYLDDGGYLSVLDRRTDLIISGGENVYPAEVEAILLEHPEVAEAAVVGVPDAKWGERPIAFVVARSHTFDPKTLARFAAQRLAAFKRPDDFVLVPDLPRTAAGKIQRHRLREQATAEMELPMEIEAET
ncbi:MAG TPA: o-succinylbenzoate--CoA ligase [Dehalococcoidia bacterium]|nr:o-succinylbenzoate--CoA ligase [Dehalococcoidia bacterium]